MPKPTDAEKMILRNQRYMMLALISLLGNQQGPGNGFHATNLIQRVKTMEQAFDWIASPSERLS